MNRDTLINTIEDLRESVDTESDIDSLIDVARDFCDNYESDFNTIRDILRPLVEYVDIVEDAHSIADRCSDELY